MATAMGITVEGDEEAGIKRIINKIIMEKIHTGEEESMETVVTTGDGLVEVEGVMVGEGIKWDFITTTIPSNRRYNWHKGNNICISFSLTRCSKTRTLFTVTVQTKE